MMTLLLIDAVERMNVVTLGQSVLLAGLSVKKDGNLQYVFYSWVFNEFVKNLYILK